MDMEIVLYQFDENDSFCDIISNLSIRAANYYRLIINMPAR